MMCCNKNKICVASGIILIIFFALAAVVIRSWVLPGQPNSKEAFSIVEIPAGAGLKDIAGILRDNRVISNEKMFIWYARLSGTAQQLQAGTYQLSAQTSIKNIVYQLAKGGGAITDVKVTFIEGWTVDEMFAELERVGLIDAAETTVISQISSAVIANNVDLYVLQSKPATASLAGYLFPDTYYFLPKSTLPKIINKMVRTLDAKITPEMRVKISASGMNFYQVLTLASIIEKEVRTPAERRIAAGIFLRRLADNYPLQSDATINFFLTKDQATTRPTAENIAIDHPYNTYQYAGLPPGPISNPSFDAIQAVLEPTVTDYYYFLTMPEPEGKAVFSKTYEEHLQQKAKYYP